MKGKTKWSGLLVAGAMLAAQAAVFPISAAARTTAEVTDDLAQIDAIAISETDVDFEADVEDSDISVYGAARAQSVTSADETNYDEDCYASYDGYATLSDAQKTLYDAMKQAAHAFYTGTEDATEVSYSGGSMACFAIVSNSDRSLTKDDVVKVISMFRNDNPIYFFIGSAFLYQTGTSLFSGSTYIRSVYLSCEDSFTDGTQRQTERETLEAGIAEVHQQVEEQESALEKARTAHDWLVDTLAYAYDENGDPDDSMISHSIVGAFDASCHTAVCEGYAKAFQVLMNASDVENFYVVGLGNGGGHAWNMAQMDDGYYYNFDATWDDTTQADTYFAAGETEFSKKHTAYTYDGTGWEFLYDLPDVPENGYDENAGTVYTEGDFTYRLFGTYAVLTAYTGDGESVTVPETAVGLPVTAIKGAFAGDADLQAVSLPNTVTALSYGDGGIGAFENCVSLKEITVPSALRRVEYHTFRNCSALEALTLPETVTRIGGAAFWNCNSLGKLEIDATACTLVSSSSIYADTVIYGYADSTAQTYADTFSRSFVLLDAKVTSTSTATTTQAQTTTKAATTQVQTTVTTTAKPIVTTTVQSTTKAATTQVQTTATTTVQPIVTTTVQSTTKAATTQVQTTATTTVQPTVTTTAQTTTKAATTLVQTTATAQPIVTTMARTTTKAATTSVQTTATTVQPIVTTTAQATTKAETTQTQTTAATTTQATAAEEILLADINRDGKCDICDAVLMYHYLNGSVQVNDLQKANMDCYADGKIDILDAQAVMLFLVHSVTVLPIEP